MAVKNDFHALVTGDLKGALQWAQFDHLLGYVTTHANLGWYVYDTLRAPPAQVMAQTDLSRELDVIARDVHARHAEDYCGIAYADDLSAPTFIKIYDPEHLGVVCGYSDNPPLPRWLLSRLAPTDIHPPPPRTGWRRWWPKRQ